MTKESNGQALKKAVKKYFKEVSDCYNLGNIESPYYKATINLLESFGCSAIDVSSGRSGSLGQNTDLKIWHLEDDINMTASFAAVEVKSIGGKESTPDQIKIEKEKHKNLIFTDNLIWQFYTADRNEMYIEITLISQSKNGFELNEDKIDLFIHTLSTFILLPANINSSAKLAEYMASYGKHLREIVKSILTNEYASAYETLNAIYLKLKTDLVSSLTVNDFADMFAQTIVYGFFIARYNCNKEEKFDRLKAVESLKSESKLLKFFFYHITSDNEHHSLEETISKLCKLYETADVKTLLDKDEKKDTIIHFYEEFLSFYDPEQRKNLGAYYTPVQVVRYMIDKVDKDLVEEFGIKRGLACNDIIGEMNQVKSSNDEKTASSNTKQIPQIAILDPSCGTGTFEAEIIKYIKKEYYSDENETFYREWIKDKNGLLSRMIGFEIMMTSYVIAKLKIRRVIAQTLGDELDESCQSNIFLTNTLTTIDSELNKKGQEVVIDFSTALSYEATSANEWKSKWPIKIIIGNPPYNMRSTNKYDISQYKFEVDGITPLKETSINSLNDDYVKFIRFAEKHIVKDGNGILAYISSNGYLENPTLRGMRASLLRTFDKIYILNLHGNSTKKERCPDGSKDENVFDIKTGVSIIVAIKTTQKKDWAKVYYAELYGLRDKKLEILESKNIAYRELSIDKRIPVFIEFNTEGRDNYEEYISIKDLYIVSASGIVSGNDDVAITNTKEELKKRIDKIKDDFSKDGVEAKNLFCTFCRGQTAKTIRDDVLKQDGKIKEVAYRPFDNRWTYYSGKSVGWLCWPRKIMSNFLQESKSPIGRNIGLVYSRGDTTPQQFSMIFITDKITDNRITAAQTAGACYVTPLYLAPEENLDWSTNFNKQVLEKLTQNLVDKPTPLEVFDYCYGVLFDPKFRRKYNEFLKRDFPRVPIIESDAQFSKYTKAGERLRLAHLMRTNEQLDLKLVSTEDIDLCIEQIRYVDDKLFINRTTAIIGIPSDVYNYYIGGYQVIDKWFKNHKSETLAEASFEHIKKVAAILKTTIEIQNELCDS